MDWKTASAYYETQLSHALNVQRHAVNLAQLPQVGIPAKYIQILSEEAEPTKRQLERLQKREFRIAVVGLEKAGKSTFINAWLECDLLPAKQARCTFTTTQIYSVINDLQQKLEVYTKSDDQFFKLLEDLKAANAQEDLNTINNHQSSLSQVRREGNLVIPFTRLEDIREPLKKYVADARYAHAVLEVRLYTNKLAQAEGIVFYDVPGLDSGLAKHVDEAREMLSDCDAVILVQRFTSLREKELDIIKFTELGDKNVSVGDKLFVFLSRIDSQATPEALQQHIEEACQDWLKRANLPSKRIVSGSSGAYLVLNNLAEQQTQQEIGNPRDIREKLKYLMGVDDEKNLCTDATGIPEIKKRIFDYINTERVEILKKRCKAYNETILDNSTEIYNLVKNNYPENPEDAKRIQEENNRIIFTEWWKKEKWEKIKADLQMFYNNYVVSKNSQGADDKSSSLEKFKGRYLELVNTEMQNLKAETLKKKDIIFAANSNPVFDRANANFRWREDLYIDVSKVLSAISSQLAAELKNESLKLVGYMTELLWGAKAVKARLIDNPENYFLLKLENSLSVLFLRFARPVAEVLIRGPVNSDTRNQIIKNLGPDVEIVDNYYSGDEPAFKVLKRYGKYGFELLTSSELRQQVLGIAGASNLVIGMVAQGINLIEESLEANQEKDKGMVVFEVENDLNAFQEYLSSAIFEAAGFESYCIQELKGLIDSFRDKEGTWIGVAMNEWLQENPKLMKEIPGNLQSHESSLEVSDRLRQLGVALRNIPTSL
jgi:predicted GTPase